MTNEERQKEAREGESRVAALQHYPIFLNWTMKEGVAAIWIWQSSLLIEVLSIHRIIIVTPTHYYEYDWHAPDTIAANNKRFSWLSDSTQWDLVGSVHTFFVQWSF